MASVQKVGIMITPNFQFGVTMITREAFMFNTDIAIHWYLHANLKHKSKLDILNIVSLQMLWCQRSVAQSTKLKAQHIGNRWSGIYDL